MLDIIAITISAITLIIAIINQIIIIKDKEPQLSFNLKSYNGILYLKVTNNGQTKAKNIRVKINKLCNNGSNNIQEDSIFQIPFELSGQETVQGMVAILGENISTHVFPYIDINVSYDKPHFIKNVKYSRQVFYMAETENKFYVETGINLKEIEHYLENIHKSELRLANYFDGNEVRPFDELNIVSKNHFIKDLINAQDKRLSEINDSDECIEKRIRKE